MTKTKGGCACGAVRCEFSCEPVMMGQCQCRACQRDSGAGHACHVAVAASGFELTGPIKYWASKADSGNVVSHVAFAPNVGCRSPRRMQACNRWCLCAQPAWTIQLFFNHRSWFGAACGNPGTM